MLKSPLTAIFRKWGTSLVTTVAILLPYMLIVRGVGQAQGVGWAFEYVYFALFFTPFLYAFLFLFLAPRLNEFKPTARVVGVLGALGVGVILAFILPIHVPEPNSNVSLAISATGEKNPNAQGTEVWLVGLARADGIQVDQSEFIPDSNWQIKDKSLMSPGTHSPAVLTWTGVTNQNMQLTLLSHAWSGIAKITWNGVVQTVDLYDPGRKNVTIDLPYYKQASPVYRTVFLSFTGITFGLLVLGVVLYFTSRNTETNGEA